MKTWQCAPLATALLSVCKPTFIEQLPYCHMHISKILLGYDMQSMRVQGQVMSVAAVNSQQALCLIPWR